MKKILFLLLLSLPVLLAGQVLAPAADGHILRNETYQFDQATGTPNGNTGLTYFVYFQDLYVGGENSFTYDFDPNDGISTHYNRELRTVVEFDISSLNLTSGSFTAYLDITSDGNFYPVTPFTLDVKAANLLDAQEDGVITQGDYGAMGANSDTQTVDGQAFPQDYAFNVTNSLDADLSDGGSYSGFVLHGDPLNGNEISFVSSYEETQGGGTGPRLRIVGAEPDISVTVGGCQDTVVGNTTTIPVQVSNAGSSDLIIDQVFELTDPGGAYDLDMTGFNTTLSAGQSSTFNVLFTPTSQGSFSVSYRITSNDPDESPYQFQLDCNGITTPQPDIDVQVAVCSDTPTGSVRAIDVLVSNAGSADLVVTSVSEVEDTSGYFQEDLSGFTTTIPAGGSSTLTVNFSPLDPGSYTATYAIASNDPDEPSVTFQLSCTAVAGAAPDIVVTPSPIVIPGVIQGSAGSAQVVIQNRGQGILDISTLTIPSGTAFTLDTTGTKLSLLSGEQTTATLTLQSSQTGFYETVLTIVSNDPDSGTLEVPVLGTVTTGGIQTIPVAAGDSSTSIMVAAAAVAPGAHGSYFVTDLKAYNAGASTITATFYFLASGSDNSSAPSTSLSLASHQTLGIKNILASLFGQEQGVGAILVVPSSAGLRVNSRTYNLTGAGTYGQSIPGRFVNEGVAVGQVGLLPGLSKSDKTRSNVGFVNLGNTTVTLHLTLTSGSQEVLAENVPYTLAPYSHLQVNDIFGSTGAGLVDNAFAKVTVDTGSVMVYASVLDNDTSDPIYVPAQ